MSVTAAKGFVASGPGFAVGGMAKGSGMIHPNLATMLAVVTTDYPLEPGEALEFLRPAVEDSFNSISVDGECSTNDAVVLLANGASGAASTAEAKAIACRIATSPLVKTALFGRDANWGRILAAAGSAPSNGGYAHLDPALVTLDMDGVRVIEHGTPRDAEPKLEGGTCTIELDLGLGDGSASYLTGDLSYEYVRINGEYRS